MVFKTSYFRPQNEVEMKLQRNNKVNYVIKTYFAKKKILTETKIRTHNTAEKATLKHGSQFTIFNEYYKTRS